MNAASWPLAEKATALRSNSSSSATIQGAASPGPDSRRSRLVSSTPAAAKAAALTMR